MDWRDGKAGLMVGLAHSWSADSTTSKSYVNQFRPVHSEFPLNNCFNGYDDLDIDGMWDFQS